MDKYQAVVVLSVAFVLALSLAYGTLLGLSVYGHGIFSETPPVQTEKIEYTGKNAYLDVENKAIFITIELKDTGNTQTQLSGTLLFNAKPAATYPIADRPTCCFTKATLNPDESTTAFITLPKGDTWKSGATVEIAVKTQTGNQYLTSVTLP